MNIDYLLTKHSLFQGIPQKEIPQLLQILDTYIKEYYSNEYIVLEGKSIKFIGVVLKGTISMQKEDYWGNNYVYTEINDNNIFGETFIDTITQKSTVSYMALTKCKILFIRYNSIIHPIRPYEYQQIIIDNLISLQAKKNRLLMEKLEIVTKYSLRQRILTFLNQQMEKHQNETIHLRMSQQELANYLCVNRSSMLRELKRMQQEGFIHYDRTTITLNKVNDIQSSLHNKHHESEEL